MSGKPFLMPDAIQSYDQAVSILVAIAKQEVVIDCKDSMQKDRMPHKLYTNEQINNSELVKKAVSIIEIESKTNCADDKIISQFVIYARPPGTVQHVVGKGYKYEKMNYILTNRNGHDCSERFSSLDEIIKTFNDISSIDFL